MAKRVMNPLATTFPMPGLHSRWFGSEKMDQVLISPSISKAQQVGATVGD